ncbi:MAG: tetratricopeptide repeat protein [Bacteroidia bacterium]
MKRLLIIFLFIQSCLAAQTERIIDSLLIRASQAKSDTERVRFENKASKLLTQVGKADEVIKKAEANLSLLKKVLSQTEKLSKNDLNNYRNNYGDCFVIGALAYGDISNYQKSREYLLKAVKEFTMTANKAGVARAYNGLGNLEFETGRYAESIKFHFASLKINEEIGNKKGMASSLNNMANIYASRGNNKEALSKYFEALKINLEEGQKVGVANAYNNIALVYSSIDKYDSALYYIQQAYKVRVELDDRRGIAACFSNLGVFYLQQHKFPEALDNFKKALKAKEDLKDIAGVGAENKNVATVLVYLNKPHEAIPYAEKGIEVAKSIDALDDIKSAYSVASMAYSNAGDYKKAYEYQSSFVELNDSSQNEKNSRIVTEMNTKYETEKKEKENQLLQAQNELSTATIRQQKIITYLVIGGLLVTVVLAFFIFKGLKKQRQANSIISKQKLEVEQQKDLVEEKQKEIIDSINYAKRIQSSLLTNKDFLDENTNENFILFKPKDIVSGDFYWATSVTGKAGSLFYLAVCDSTGHGVPGAFMSLLNIGFLSEAIKEKDILDPNEVFNYVRQRLIDSISKEEQKDGFDGILLCVNKTTNKITYAAANNNPVLVTNNNLINLKADNMPVGKGERVAGFNLFEIEAKKGDTIYLFTDGFPDQFGGPKGKKFKYRQLEEILLTNHALPLSEQAVKLNTAFEEWKGNLEQIDDVLIIGIKI